MLYVPNIKIHIQKLNITPTFLASTDELLYMAESHEREKIILNKYDNSVKSINLRAISGATIYKDSLHLPSGYMLNYHNGEIQIKYNNISEGFAWDRGIPLGNGKHIFGNYGYRIFKNKIPEYSSEGKFDIKITVLFNDKKGKIWIGTLNGMYSVLENDLSQIKKEKSGNTFFDNRISSIIPNSTNGMWVATIGGGIAQYNEEELQIKITSQLSSPIVHQLELENDSTLWIATNKGLDKLDFSNSPNGGIEIKKIRSYNTSNGLISNYINDIEFWNDSLWLATKEGIMSLDPLDLIIKDNGPNIKIDSIVTEIKSLDLTKSYKLEYDENDININYTGISLRKPQKEDFYAYKLIKDKEKTEWRNTNNRSLQFMNLDYGKYEFVIKAKNKDDIWSETISYEFEIKSHFTEKILFRLLLIILILFSMFLVYRYREQQLLKQEGQKRKIQQSELRAQKAELDALRGQMNPHFVYNAMNSIQNYIFKNEPENANFYLSKISRLMRNSLQMSKLDFVTIEEEFTFLNTYLELEQMRFQNKFDFEFITNSNVATETTLPPLILQPLIENIIKHAFKGIKYKGKILINIAQKNENQLSVTISDNGVGLDYSLKHKSNLEHVSLSIRIIEERLQIINAEHNSQMASLKIKDRLISEGIRGTKVELTLPFKTREKETK